MFIIQVGVLRIKHLQGLIVPSVMQILTYVVKYTFLIFVEVK